MISPIAHARRCATLLTGAATLLAMAIGAPARADNDRYAAFVADQSEFQILHARRAQAERHPASLTKMMTLYMLFEAIESGELALDDEITVSEHAASRTCSCLGLEAGDTLPVETAIRALIIRSANDVAAAVGEHLADSEAEFAAAMTRRARRLGLENTVFRNASGLPDRRQVTTAQDMARLGIALHRDFPEYFHYFSETRMSWEGRVHRNHNTLVGRVDGVDGLKTGYIRSSGFNLVASAERGEHRLVAVVMGGPSAAARDAHAEELLEAAFNALERRDDETLLAGLTSPRLNPARLHSLLAADIEALGLDAPTEMGSARSAPPLRVEIAATDEIEPRLPGTVDPAFAASGAWSVQVGAYASREAALARLESVAAMSSDLRLDSAMARSVDAEGRALWRARFERLAADQARRVCAALSARGEACYAVAPGG